MKERYLRIVERAPRERIALAIADELCAHGIRFLTEPFCRLFADSPVQTRVADLHRLVAGMDPSEPLRAALTSSSQPIVGELAMKLQPGSVAPVAEQLARRNPFVVEHIGAIYAESPAPVLCLGFPALLRIARALARTPGPPS